jgi:hypothetical protein
MAFIMQNLPRSCSLIFLLSLAICPGLSSAEQFSAVVRDAKLIENDETYSVEAEIDYHLSPISKEALHKGVPLAWNILIEIRSPFFMVESVVYQKNLPYSLQFHALLNQYEVKSPRQNEMFLSLNAALNFMSMLQDVVYFNKNLLKSGEKYQLAIKAGFNRELLPVPLRPFSYLDSQWFLSSDWFVCTIQK